MINYFGPQLTAGTKFRIRMILKAKQIGLNFYIQPTQILSKNLKLKFEIPSR